VHQSFKTTWTLASYQFVSLLSPFGPCLKLAMGDYCVQLQLMLTASNLASRHLSLYCSETVFTVALFLLKDGLFFLQMKDGNSYYYYKILNHVLTFQYQSVEY